MRCDFPSLKIGKGQLKIQFNYQYWIKNDYKEIASHPSNFLTEHIEIWKIFIICCCLWKFKLHLRRKSNWFLNNAFKSISRPTTRNNLFSHFLNMGNFRYCMNYTFKPTKLTSCIDNKMHRLTNLTFLGLGGSK